jgi:type III secretion protein U
MVHMTTLDATVAFGDRLVSTFAALSAFMPAILTPLGIGALAVLVPELMQTRGLLAFKRVIPDVKRLNPVNGLKQMFSLRLLWDIVLTLVQFAILLFLFAQALAWMAASQIVPAAADYFIQRFLWLRGLRMDKSEIKREFRDDEGDPYVKNRRRTLHRELGQ